MKKLLFLAMAAALTVACGCSGNTDDKPVVPEEEVFAKGADLGWITEMESKGYKFYNENGAEMECTALFKSIGFNAVRHRVWVNPANGWCSKEDLLEKCKRAKLLGMKIMVDFHYSDYWADPGKQYVPAAWADYTPVQMAQAVADHTKEVLSLLKANDIDVEWVQVGNEVPNGMLWESGRVAGDSVGHFVEYFTSGYNAVKAIYPDATVILHIDNGWDMKQCTWFFDLMAKNNCKYDMIGLSLYPSYWDAATKKYPDWNYKTTQLVMNIPQIYEKYSKPIMLTEFGMPVSEPQKAKDALQFLMDNTMRYDYFKGIFLWEPESEHARNGYDYGAFENGRPTIALDPFKPVKEE